MTGLVSKALVDIARERMRQKERCGYSDKHDDDMNDDGEIVRAAICYAMCAAAMTDPDVPHHLFPWSSGYWKSIGRRADLVKSAALIVAEIDRLDRAAEQGDTVDVILEARLQVAKEEFEAAVRAEKEKFLAAKWWHKFVPFKIVITRRKP